MKFINTDGSAIIGPGSEWLWTALSGAVLAVTFLAIYRQLRLQTSATARQQLAEINQEWGSERMLRKRLATYETVLAGVHMDVDTPIVWETCNFWEHVGSLTRLGHLDLSLMQTNIGAHVTWWWAVMGPACKTAREEADARDLFEHFEWLANEMLKTDSAAALANSRPVTPEVLKGAIATTRASLALEESLRSVHLLQRASS